jgi:ABC-type Fe3+ transport system substrate-binding protein
MIDERLRDPDGAFTPVTVLAIAPTYNTKLLSAEQAPRNAQDFLKPEFKGKLITPYPHDDDATLFAFYTIIKKYGWEWMDSYMANSPKFIQGHLGTIRSVISGESVATLDMIVEHTVLDKAQGEPVEIAFSDKDAMPAWGQRGAVFKDAPHPNAARLYMTWFMEKEQQAKSGTWSARKDVPPPAGLKPIFEYNIATDYADIVTNRPMLLDLRKRFLGYTGEITAKGGIR